MSFWPRRYHMLICSLPALPARFDGGKPPISLERLKDRLRMLEEEDAEEIRRFLEVLAWNEKFAETSDEAVAQRYAELMGRIRHPLIHEAAAAVVDARMIVTALRRRRRKLGPPEIGIGQWSDHVRRHFAEPHFRLGHLYPRLGELSRLLEEGDALGFQKTLLEGTWAYLRKRATDHLFDFEAVVLYVARWALMNHWTRMEAERGRAIFESLVTEALGKHADAFA